MDDFVPAPVPQPEWKPIPGYVGIYDIRQDGAVRVRARTVKQVNGVIQNKKPKLLKTANRTHMILTDQNGKKTSLSIIATIDRVWGSDAAGYFKAQIPRPKQTPRSRLFAPRGTY